MRRRLPAEPLREVLLRTCPEDSIGRVAAQCSERGGGDPAKWRKRLSEHRSGRTQSISWEVADVICATIRYPAGYVWGPEW